MRRRSPKPITTAEAIAAKTNNVRFQRRDFDEPSVRLIPAELLGSSSGGAGAIRDSSSSGDNLGPLSEFSSNFNEGSFPRSAASLVCSKPAVVNSDSAVSSEADCSEICPAGRDRV